MKPLAPADYDRAVLAAHARYSIALAAKDEHERRAANINRELEAAEAELRALARRQG